MCKSHLNVLTLRSNSLPKCYRVAVKRSSNFNLILSQPELLIPGLIFVNQGLPGPTKHDVVVQVITLGGAVTSIQVPDKNGKVEDVVAGYDTVEGEEQRVTLCSH